MYDIIKILCLFLTAKFIFRQSSLRAARLYRAGKATQKVSAELLLLFVIHNIDLMDQVDTRTALHAVDTSSLVDRVEMKMIELFVEKGFKVGDSIPKELELSETLGVSRTVIREALSTLR